MSLLQELESLGILLEDHNPRIVIFTTQIDTKITDFLNDDYCFEVCIRNLSLHDQLKVRNAKTDRVKRLVSFLFTKLVLNYCIYLLGETTSFDPWRTLEFEYNEFGKPSLKNSTRFVFNSSSSNNMMAIAVQFDAATAIGVDLSHEVQESISPVRFMEQFDGIFSPRERECLLSVADLQNRYIAFNQLWTLKEAFTKYVGCGLNVDLSSFCFHAPLGVISIRNATEGNGFVYNYDIDWQTDISVDYLNLPKVYAQAIGERELTCCTGVLKSDTDLPVLISLVGDFLASLNPSTNVHLNFSSILRGIVD